MNILIAEDQAMAAIYLRRILERLGHQVAVAHDGEEAWTMLQQQRTPLLISDWMMPRLDGPDLCRRIRQAPADQYTYIILLTSLDRRDDKLTGLRAGADDFLIKPPDADELALRLEIAERILAVHDQLARQNTRLAELAAVDELTGVKNRRRFREDLELLYAQAERMHSPLSLVMLDIDHFKEYNDAYGHPAGDIVLMGVGTLLRTIMRGHDVVARYGGEEFAVLLPGTNEEESIHIAERLRLAIAAKDWPHRPITASIGIATTGDSISCSAALVDRADRALYRSKALGRNRATHDVDCDSHAPAHSAS